jgi:hypothetical protein
MSEILSAHFGSQYISDVEQSHKTSELYQELGSKPPPSLPTNQTKKDEPTNFFEIQDKERRRQYARELAGNPSAQQREEKQERIEIITSKLTVFVLFISN